MRTLLRLFWTKKTFLFYTYHFVQGLTMSFDDIRNITFANNKGIINIDPFIADEGTHMDSY